MSWPSLAPEAVKAVETTAYHLYAFKYYALGSFVMLVYDTLLTLDREVEAIWRARWSCVKVLFLFNRYAPIVAYAVSTVGKYPFKSHTKYSQRALFPVDQHYMPTGHSLCQSYALFPGVFNLIQQGTLGCILLLFMFAIFNRSRIILGIVATTILAQIVVTGWSLTVMVAIPLPPGFIGCIWGRKSGTGLRIVTGWIMQLVFVTVIFALMIWKAFQLRREKVDAPLIQVLTKDGLKHFSVIFAVNLINVMTFSLARPADLRPLNATFSALLTVVVTNRMILSVREEADRFRYAEAGAVGGYTPHTARTSQCSPVQSYGLDDDTELDLRRITEVYVKETESWPSQRTQSRPDE